MGVTDVRSLYPSNSFNAATYSSCCGCVDKGNSKASSSVKEESDVE